MANAKIKAVVIYCDLRVLSAEFANKKQAIDAALELMARRPGAVRHIFLKSKDWDLEHWDLEDFTEFMSAEDLERLRDSMMECA